MSSEYKKLNEKELLQSTGGVSGLASLGSGPVMKVKGLTTESISLKRDPSSDGTEIAQLKNGDVVQVVGGKFHAGDTSTTYTQVYVPSLKQSGWVNSDFLG